jgi:hypothetical protein
MEKSIFLRHRKERKRGAELQQKEENEIKVKESLDGRLCY